MPAASAPSPAFSAETQRFLPWLVAVALFMENLDATIVNTAVPVMAESLKVVPLALKAVLTSYTLSLAVFIPVSGWMADRFGTKRVFLYAVWVFAVGSLCCGLAANVPMLVASRILQGIGGAMMTPVARIALVRTFPRSELLRTMNYVIIPALIGPMLGPFVGGVIVHWLHWRMIFFVNLPFAAAGIWMVHRYMPDFRDDLLPPLDRVGFLLFGAGIALLSYVLEVFGEHNLPAGHLSLLLAAAVVLLGAYGWHAQRTPSPVLVLALFRIRTFRLSVIGGFVTRLGVGGMPFLLPLLYQLGLGYAPWQAGLLTMPTAAAAMLMKLSSRPLLARFGHRTILITNTADRRGPHPFHLDRPRCPGLGHSRAQFLPGILHVAAVHEHEFAHLRRRLGPGREQGEQHCQHRPADVAQLRRRLGVARGGLVPARPESEQSRRNRAGTAPCVHRHGATHHGLVPHLLGPAGQRRQQRQQPRPRARRGRRQAGVMPCVVKTRRFSSAPAACPC